MSSNISSKTPVVALICIVLVQRFLSSSFACSFEKHARKRYIIILVVKMIFSHANVYKEPRNNRKNSVKRVRLWVYIGG